MTTEQPQRPKPKMTAYGLFAMLYALTGKTPDDILDEVEAKDAAATQPGTTPEEGYD